MSNLVCYLATLVHAGARCVELRSSEVDEFADNVVVANTYDRQTLDREALKDAIRRGDAMFMGVPVVVVERVVA